MSRTALGAVFALLAGILGGAILMIAFAQPPSAPGFSPVRVPGVSDVDRIQAMVSIQAHALFSDDERVAPVIELPEAVRILRADHGGAADSRRRRAIAALAAYGINRDGFGEAITQLGGDLDFLRAQIEIILIPGPLPVDQLEIKLANILDFFTPLCKWHTVKGGVDEMMPPIQWSFQISVPRSFHDVARALDAQSWDQCSPFFPSSYLVDVPDSCCPYKPGGDCSFSVDGSTGDPVEANPLPAGSPYSEKAVFEDVCFDETDSCAECRATNTCDANVENLLCVTSDYDPSVSASFLVPMFSSKYSVDFHWTKAITGEMGGMPARVSLDQGSVKVRKLSGPSTAWSQVNSNKTLMFDTGMSAALGQLLLSLEKELAQELVELACCDVKPEPWGWWWPFPPLQRIPFPEP